MNRYSQMKPLWWYVRDGGLPAVPKQVAVSISDLCNQDCAYCVFRVSGNPEAQHFADGKLASVGHNNPTRMMDTSRAVELVRELARAGVLSVQFTGGGEPTAHPEHEAVFEAALRAGLKCALVSNAVKWGPRLIEGILPLFSWVRVSMDGATPERYAAIRRVSEAHFRRAWANVGALADAITASRSSCVLGIGMVVTVETVGEIREMARRAMSAGARYLRLIPEFSPGDESALLDPRTGLIGAAKADVDAQLLAAYADVGGTGFEIYDQVTARSEDLTAARPDYRLCAYQHFNNFIGADLKVYRCCHQAYNDRGLMAGGDMAAASFDEWARSPERAADLAAFDARGCDSCRFHSKNRPISDIAEGEPEHKEFA